MPSASTSQTRWMQVLVQGVLVSESQTPTTRSTSISEPATLGSTSKQPRTARASSRTTAARRRPLSTPPLVSSSRGSTLRTTQCHWRSRKRKVASFKMLPTCSVVEVAPRSGPGGMTSSKPCKVNGRAMAIRRLWLESTMAWRTCLPSGLAMWKHVRLPSWTMAASVWRLTRPKCSVRSWEIDCSGTTATPGSASEVASWEVTALSLDLAEPREWALDPATTPIRSYWEELRLVVALSAL
mmetsp:Transcript_9509/g.20855  ORF Transcript_9509/g.20855 Transcript_9509/m.20855 type:complete len:240 (+) Transcript_9509:1477-2196(+)